ncbi:hypothetical protein FHS23_002940 [Prauserella isguenensis]|uniref:Uncharacterized protein n=1 Tax=Prauserella isguenensis TaxID=1470180 RepID=A0A839S1H1_9PSEU|nr:hypothetical protein [Prauserella isguenensis]MBB3051911.1 hypothetical protein [Prauserella isguenensis]
MSTGLLIFYGILGLLGLLVVVGIGLSVVQQLRIPIENRKRQVLDELRKNETGAGTTYISRGHRIGVRDDAVRELADAHGYRWTGYRGRRLTFQRKLHGAAPHATPVSTTGTSQQSATPTHSAFLAQLATLTPDSSGTARVDLGDFEPSSHKELVQLAETHGWAYVRPDRRDGRTGFLAARTGSETVTINDHYFVKGPGVEELRRHPAAHDAAVEAERRFGVNPLSRSAYNAAAARYKKDSQRANRWAALFTVPFLALVVVVPTTASALGDSGTDATTILAIWTVLAVLVVVGVLGLTRAHRGRKANLAPYEDAYDTVARAVAGGGRDLEDRAATTDDGL